MALFGIGACLTIIGLISYMIVDAFRVLKYGLEGDDEDED
nr:MAG TPA: Nuclear Pore Complex Protein Nup98/Nuclear, autoproteolysis, nuclear pore, TRANSFERASE.0A [Caudoviricetes sp.]